MAGSGAPLVRKKGSLPESVMKVALALAHFASADHTGACHPKLETLSAKAGVCVKTAQRALAALEQIQLVHRFRAPTIRSRWPITYYTLCLHEHAWHEADERARDAENALRERERAICPGGGACSAARSELDRASGQTDQPAEIVRASPQPLSVSGADDFRTLDDAEKRTDLRSSGQCGWSPDVLQMANHGGILLYEKDIKMENRTASDALKRTRAREAVSRPTPTTTGAASTARTEVTSAARTLSGDHRSDPLRRPERRHGPRANGLALERSEEVEDQPAARAHDVERFGDRAESEAPTVEDLDRLDELLQRARPAVELPDDERVALGA